MASSDFPRERAADRILGPVVGRHATLSDRQRRPRRPAAGPSRDPGTRPTCRRASPRAPARVLLVVAGHRLETPARGAVAAWDWTSDVATTIWGVREVAGTSRDGSTDGAETTGS